MRTIRLLFLWAATCFYPLFLLSQNTELELQIPADLTCPVPTPAIAFAVPDAFMKGYFGTITGGATLQSRTRLSGDKIDPDGNLSLGLGLGNPEGLLGAEFRTNIYGLANNQGAGGNFGEGTIDFHLSHQLMPNFWVGAGVYDLTGWDREEPNQVYSGYLTATQVVRLRDEGFFQKIYLTGGMGNGRFRPNENFNVTDASGVGFFGSVAVSIVPQANFIAEWKGYNVVTGLSFIPHKKWPAQIIIGMNDAFHEKRSLLLAGSLNFFLFKNSTEPCRRNKGWIGPPPAQPSRI